MSRAAHWDVAAYALGVLDETEAERFEEHLAGCWACAGELESMLPVVNLLSEVDGENLVTAEQSRSDGRLLDRMIVEVGAHRRRTRSRQLLAAAAAVVVLALATGLSLFAGGRLFGSGDTPPDVVGQGGPAVTQTGPPPSPGNSGPGIGGPGTLPEDGEEFNGSDKQTGVQAKLVLETKIWGTQVSFQLSNLTGPRTCRLVVIPESSPAEVVHTWAVPPSGYGTPARPEPLLLQSGTAIPRNEIESIQVQSIDENGIARPLLNIPV